ncbi:hypothetical protein [Delftia lacustris]
MTAAACSACHAVRMEEGATVARGDGWLVMVPRLMKPARCSPSR